MREAILYDRLQDGSVHCRLCAQGCTIKPGSRGICSVRENRDGTLMSLTYGRLVSTAIDPIEKKPLFHFLPGSRTFSIASAGCNLRCSHCQNSDISQWPREHRGAALPGRDIPPQQIVELAKQHDCESIAFTYTEPTLLMEYALDVAMMGRAQGIRSVFVSNGFMTRETVELLAPIISAINIDLKGDDNFYRMICGARLDPVRETIALMHEMGVWVEVTTLVIPGHNDSDEDLGSIAKFIASVDRGIPWHVTRFHPTYKLKDAPVTPVETLRRARETGLSHGLHYVYEGNVPGAGYENTKCPHCGELLIERHGYEIRELRISGGATCFNCGTIQAGVF